MSENKTAREALVELRIAIDSARMVPLPGAGGMTIEANMRNSVYNGVNVWEVEAAFEKLERALRAPEASSCPRPHGRTGPYRCEPGAA